MSQFEPIEVKAGTLVLLHGANVHYSAGAFTNGRCLQVQGVDVLMLILPVSYAQITHREKTTNLLRATCPDAAYTYTATTHTHS